MKCVGKYTAYSDCDNNATIEGTKYVSDIKVKQALVQQTYGTEANTERYFYVKDNMLWKHRTTR